jgi:GNAT superfamily N-acetyltransferase
MDDIPALTHLINLSVRALQAQDYSIAQMDGALGTVFGVDTQLIHDRTYFVVESPLDHASSTIIGCGGWSQRRTLFGGDHGPVREDVLLDPLRENAKIRAFFIHPNWARRGVGTLILDTCESAARAAGFGGFEMAATLTGVRLFSVRGYSPLARIDVPLSNGATLPVVRMSKRA